MAKLTTSARKKLPAKEFALSGGRYPIEDKAHARNALARVSQFGSPSEKSKVRAAVHNKFPEIGGMKSEAATGRGHNLRHKDEFRNRK